MIRRLKKRFVTAAMAALLVILMSVLFTANFLFWRHSTENIDVLLGYLAENDGGFHTADLSSATPPDHPDDLTLPVPPDGKPDPEASIRRHHLWEKLDKNPETAFRTRCFSVIYDAQGQLQSVRTDRIAAISESEALDYAEKVLKKGRTRGFTGVYRYYVQAQSDETFVGFLDCSDSLSNMRLLAFISCGLLIFCLAAMWGLLWLLSGRAIAPVVESMEKQRRFIADAGHELKTPLTIINADIAVLSMTQESNEWTNSIQNQTRRLDGLVKELLTLSRMESKVTFKPLDFPLSHAAEDTVNGFIPLIATGNRRLETHIAPDIVYRGDEADLRRLISILMENAAKYTPEGGWIRFTLKKSGHNVIIESANTCIPFEKKHLARLFDRFYRVDAARTQTTGGYGIGLSIASEIVVRHHGKIKATCPQPDIIVFTATLA